MDALFASYEMTEQEFLDVNKRFYDKVVPLKKLSIIFAALMALVAVVLIIERQYVWMAFAVAITAIFVVMMFCASRKYAQNAKSIFVANSRDGILRYELELTETELILRNPDKGNVSHYARGDVVKSFDLKNYVIVQFSAAVAVPIVKNEQTQPIIDAIVPQKKVYVAVEKK